MKSRILVSFSAGTTSGLMAYLIRQMFPKREVVFVFSNTGCEDEKTLQYADQCDREMGLGLVWLEALVHSDKGTPTQFTEVSFATASRQGEPFEAVVAKYGLPGPKYPHCTRELKLQPIHTYAQNKLGWEKGSYSTCIGLRADEIDRISEDAKRRYGALYPLLSLGVTKADVREFWGEQSYALELPEHRGNCVWCWKKSFKKLCTLADETPGVFDFPRHLEKNYSSVGAPDKPRTMFRGGKTTVDILDLAAEPFARFEDPFFDVSNGCGESCEIYADGPVLEFDL